MNIDLTNLTKTERHALRLMIDFEYAAQHLLKVQTIDAQILPLTLNGPQKLLNRIFDRIKQTRLLRAVILKGRRFGVSTFVSGRYYHKTSWNANRRTMQITHDPDSTETLFGMVKRYYELSPEQLRPQRRANNRKLIDFNTPDGKGLNSQYRVATSGKEDVGSGQLVHYLHCSEVAKWDASNANTILDAVLQCVPKNGTADTEVVYESTANGIGGVFYDKFWGARYRIIGKRLDDKGELVLEESINENASKDNVETAIFLPWFCFEMNSLPAPAWYELDKTELEIQAKYNLSKNQMYWRRFTIANECRGSIDIFNQEHPDTPEVAFLGTGRPIFDSKKVAALRDTAPPPKTRYAFAPSRKFEKNPNGELRVWSEPQSNRHYVIGADVAEGLERGDFSVADVIDHQTGEQVAQWHGTCESFEFAMIISELGKRYNLALIAVESNNHGHSVNQFLFHDCKYPPGRIHFDAVPDPPNKPKKRYGWFTNSKTKPEVIDQLIKELAEGSHGIKCKETFDEMLSYKRNSRGGMEADSGRHDDRVMSMAIAKTVRQRHAVPKLKMNGASVWKTKDTPDTPASSGRKKTLGWT